MFNKLNEYRVAIIAIAFFIFIGIAIAGWVKAPAIAKEAKKKAMEAKDSVQEVANTLKTYIIKQDAVQEQKAIDDKEYKELLHEWIKEVSKK